jgi:hypothetical protein
LADEPSGTFPAANLCALRERMTVAMYPASALRQGDLLFEKGGGHQRKSEKRVECHQKLQTSHPNIWYCFNDIFNQLREGFESDSIMCALKIVFFFSGCGDHDMITMK